MAQSSCVALWQATVAPDEPHKFARRLSWDGLSEEGFERWLKSDGTENQQGSSDWQNRLALVSALLQEAWDLPLMPVSSEEDQRPFVDLWQPLHAPAMGWLQERIGSIALDGGIEPAVFAQLADALIKRLCSVAEQALWSCFSSERTPGTMLLAHLGASGDGSSPPVREHYEAFVQRHRRDGLQSLLEEFPVLGRLVGTVIELWLQASADMLERVASDRPVLESKFGISANHRLVGIKQGLSDPHRGGRAVAILSFGLEGDRASALKVVYKPKDMRLDAAYQQVLLDLNQRSNMDPLRMLQIHCGSGYGYMEYVSHQICIDDQELNRFYYNAGRLTAVLHILGCTDCHHENLIACGDQLLLIDTETLLEADVFDHVTDASDQPDQIQASGLQKRFQRSVLRSGLLPQWMFLGGQKIAVDISAFGVMPPRHDSTKMAGWLGLNSDGMMPGRVSVDAEVPTSLPVGIGSKNVFDLYLHDFQEGFKTQCEELIAVRDSWLQPGGIFSLFVGLPRRIVLRATRVYFAIQRQQLEPESLRSSLAQALKLEQLSRSFLLAESRPHHWPVFASELEQMRQLDIPFFTHPLDGDALHLDETEGLLPGFLETSGLASARERLMQLSAEEIQFQLKLIAGSTSARVLRESEIDVQNTPVSVVDSGINEVTDSDRTNSAAIAIFNRLNQMAIHDSNGQVEWLGMDLGADGESFSFGPVGLSLYGGSIGIACFEACLRQAEPTFADGESLSTSILIALKSLMSPQSADSRLRWWRDQALGISGCGGILLGLQQLGQRDWVDMLVDALLPRFIEADQQLDVIGGSAGLIGSLLVQNTENALSLAVRAGDHLLESQQSQGSWLCGRDTKGLLGFSHGTAGYAAALARLHAATGEERFRKGAEAALAYERGFFQPQCGNWPDFRDSSKAAGADHSFMVAWCHGAPGIALGRTCLWGTELWDQQCEEEIKIAIQTTVAHSEPRMDHLCCGGLGLMAVLEAAVSGPWCLERETRAMAAQKADRYRASALERCSSGRLDLRCFQTQEGSLFLPGLMTGVSGMGLALINDQKARLTLWNLMSAGLYPINDWQASVVNNHDF